ncbi:uncharacterized protein LOC107773578 [Nicotiana tabacum]|uniref:Uncharacterized protein LOC107773578 n=1 Tax=Nicotiana tabacum TaxID=4097 RepID=A0A1S3Y8W7_TOBAC|nr:uncharacterized protein LOC104101400 [Nicotiana tomentosiformis]XP_016448464.1 PREDICTED: uncharacterized protein LOC107773578 [Nicotiana tabacum]
MGNCIVLQEKVVKVMKTDGKILEYKAPIKVYQVLSQFGGQYAISESLSVIQNLLPNSNMLAGQLYYLLPILPVPPPKIAKKKKVVKFAKEVVDQEEAKKQIRTTEAVRIKLVISKKELQALLSSTEGGLITVNDIVNRLQKIQDIKLGDPVLKQ